jgi:hypothetical protein
VFVGKIGKDIMLSAGGFEWLVDRVVVGSQCTELNGTCEG